MTLGARLYAASPSALHLRCPCPKELLKAHRFMGSASPLEPEKDKTRPPRTLGTRGFRVETSGSQTRSLRQFGVSGLKSQHLPESTGRKAGVASCIRVVSL